MLIKALVCSASYSAPAASFILLLYSNTASNLASSHKASKFENVSVYVFPDPYLKINTIEIAGFTVSETSLLWFDEQFSCSMACAVMQLTSVGLGIFAF